MTDKQDPIAHAARLLREAAEELRQAHAYNNSEGWENETDAKAAYDDHLAAAQALEDWEAAIGAGGVSGPLVGRVPLSANAGEPVAWQYRRLPDVGGVWFECSKERAEQRAAHPDRWEVRPLYAAPPTAQAEGWTKLPGQLPGPGMPVLLDIGKKYPIRAMWAAKHTVQAADDDTDWGEYVEEDDMYYAPEGWYEWNQCEDNHWRVTETPRAWMPLPPTSAEGVEHG